MIGRQHPQPILFSTNGLSCYLFSIHTSDTDLSAEGFPSTHYGNTTSSKYTPARTRGFEVPTSEQAGQEGLCFPGSSYFFFNVPLLATKPFDMWQRCDVLFFSFSLSIAVVCQLLPDMEFAHVQS